MDLLPDKFRGKALSDFIYSNANRPREVIAFFNACICAAVDRPRLNVQNVQAALAEYSRLRLRALGEEWSRAATYAITECSTMNNRFGRM